MTDEQIDTLFANDHFKEKLNEYILENLKVEKLRYFHDDNCEIQKVLTFADKVVEESDDADWDLYD